MCIYTHTHTHIYTYTYTHIPYTQTDRQTDRHTHTHTDQSFCDILTINGHNQATARHLSFVQRLAVVVVVKASPDGEVFSQPLD